jgi:hypothetical protein
MSTSYCVKPDSTLQNISINQYYCWCDRCLFRCHLKMSSMWTDCKQAGLQDSEWTTLSGTWLEYSLSKRCLKGTVTLAGSIFCFRRNLKFLHLSPLLFCSMSQITWRSAWATRQHLSRSLLYLRASKSIDATELELNDYLMPNRSAVYLITIKKLLNVNKNTTRWSENFWFTHKNNLLFGLHLGGLSL